MKIALSQARSAGMAGEVPVGAVIALDGKTLSRAGGRTVAGSDPTAHAEIVVLRRACRRAGNYRLTGSTMYVTLEPCPMCAAALVWARVRRVVYAARNPRYGACGSVFNLARSRRLNHRVELRRGPFAAEAGELLRGFFKSRRNPV